MGHPADEISLTITSWPGLPHFRDFAFDPVVEGIRLNSAMVTKPELTEVIAKVASWKEKTRPLWFDVKGWQLRTEQVLYCDEAGRAMSEAELAEQPAHHLELVMNHAIHDVPLPFEVLFKAGEDWATLNRIEDDGRRLVFEPGGPQWEVFEGESIHVRHPSLRLGGYPFTDIEKEKIELAVRAGFTRYFLSYVADQAYIDEFRELVGHDAEIRLKIEDRRGLQFVEREFKKQDGLTLVLAQGDLYVEVEQPYEILDAAELILAHDPEAIAGSRLLLSVVDLGRDQRLEKTGAALVHRPVCRWFLPYDQSKPLGADCEANPVPACADFQQLAWLHDIGGPGQGYKHFMLCDEMCLRGDLLEAGIASFDAWRNNRLARNRRLATPRKRGRARIVQKQPEPKPQRRSLWSKLGLSPG